MNIILIGNGFDLAHGLPTRYVDFLEFCKRIKKIFTVGCKTFENDYLDNWEINNEIKEMLKKEYNNRKLDKQSFDNGIYSQEIVTQSEILNELYNLIKENVWIEYFFECDMFQKDNWIDFESEISNVIKSLNKDVNVYNFENDIQYISNDFLKEVLSISQEILTYRQLRDRLLNDLNKFIRAFEIYLTEYVEKIDIKVISPDIEEIVVDYKVQDFKRVVLSRVISFNYSNTYERVYWDKSYRKIGYYSLDYIHGKADINNSIETNNMVLGIDEYLEDDRKNEDINFIAFKKFYQRIYKQTGSWYRIWINKIREDYFEYIQKQIATKKYVSDNIQTIEDHLASYIITYKRHNNFQLYIFGHSLDITDRDVLKNLILNDNVYTTIFYVNKDVMGQQIANLVKVIGQDELIRRTGGSTRTIEFKQQQDMIPIKSNKCTCDQLYHLKSQKNLKNTHFLDRIKCKLIKYDD